MNDKLTEAMARVNEYPRDPVVRLNEDGWIDVGTTRPGMGTFLPNMDRSEANALFDALGAFLSRTPAETVSRELQWCLIGKHDIYRTEGNEKSFVPFLEHSTGPACFEVYDADEGWDATFWHGNQGHHVARLVKTSDDAKRACQDHFDKLCNALQLPAPQPQQTADTAVPRGGFLRVVETAPQPVSVGEDNEYERAFQAKMLIIGFLHVNGHGKGNCADGCTGCAVMKELRHQDYSPSGIDDIWRSINGLAWLKFPMAEQDLSGNAIKKAIYALQLPAPQPVSTGEDCQEVFERLALTWMCTFEKLASGEYKDERTFYIYGGWKEAWQYLASRPPVPSVVGVPSVEFEELRKVVAPHLACSEVIDGITEDVLKHLLTRQPDMGGKS